MPNEDLDAMLETLKKAAAALRDAGVPFMLGGGLAVWVRGGPETDHDLDLIVKPDDAEAYNGLRNIYNAQRKFDLAAEASA